jgi:methionyl aminopeptidase
VIPALTGHGIGRTIHEPPTVPNYYDAYDTTVLTEGMVVTIEPIVAVGTDDVRVEDDGWTLSTADGRRQPVGPFRAHARRHPRRAARPYGVRGP